MAKVAIVMGSDSDMPIMKKAAEFLDQMGIDFEMTIISAHREPDIFFEWAKGAKDRGVKVIIAGAGNQLDVMQLQTTLKEVIKNQLEVIIGASAIEKYQMLCV